MRLFNAPPNHHHHMRAEMNLSPNGDGDLTVTYEHDVDFTDACEFLSR